MSAQFLYVGTHRRAQRADPSDAAFGIYSFRKGGTGLLPVELTPTPQPGWLASHPGGRVLYAVNEMGQIDGTAGGAVSAFSIDARSGALQRLNVRRTASRPCHCQVDASGRYLLVATFGGGSVHLFPLHLDGRIGPAAAEHRHEGSGRHPVRQAAPHAHAVCLDRANRFVLVPDLGIDRLVVYELDRAGGRLVPQPGLAVNLPAGSGPRHLTFDAAGGFVYLMNEMSASISVFEYTASTGGLRPIQSIALLPKDFSGLRSGAAIVIHPDGRFLYATTRSHGSSGPPPLPGLNRLVWFAIAPDGRLRLAGRVESGGEIPRDCSFGPDGRLYVAHQGSGNIVSFCIDPATGAPQRIGEDLPTPVPVCLRWVTPA